MSQIAGLVDLSGAGSPADIGTYVVPCTTIVYKHTISGVTFVAAARSGERGWRLIDHRLESDANNLAVIQAALNSLAIPRIWQETVVIIGNFTVSGKIRIPSYIILELYGKITLTNNSNVNLIENSDTVGGNVYITMIHGYYDGNGANQGADMSTIYMQNVTHSKFLDFTTTGGHRSVAVRGEGLELYGSSFNTIEGVHAFGNQYDGIKLRNDSLHNSVENCILWDNWASGVQCAYGANSNTIEGNTVYTTARVSNPLAPYTRGFSVHTAESNTFTGNTIFNVNRGILVLAGAATGTYHNVFSSNTIVNSEYGIYSMPAGGVVENNEFESNIIYNIDEAGIYAGNMAFRENTISTNYIMDVGNVGVVSGSGLVFSGGSSTDNQIIGNYIIDTAEMGIFINAAAPRNVIKENFIHSAGVDGMYIAGANYTEISANRIYNSIGGDGLTLVGNLCSVVGNYIYDSDAAGITIWDANECLVQGNFCVGNGLDGIFLRDNSDLNFLDGNYCTDNTGYGINISANTCDSNKIGINMLQGNTAGNINDASPDNTEYAIKSAVFGDGRDGDFSTVGNVTLTRDMYYQNLTVNNGHTILTDGYSIYVSAILTVNIGGIISVIGAGGGAAVAGAGGSAGLGGGSPRTWMGGGGNGVAGATAAAAGVNNGTAGNAGSISVKTFKMSAGGSAGGSGGNHALVAVNGSNGSAGSGGGQGGGGGAGSGIGATQLGGGGSGGGGGCMAIYAKSIINNGTIIADGGNGGAGAVSGADKGGNGGGGGGGVVYLAYESFAGSDPTVAGGIAGVGGNGGAAGSAGLLVKDLLPAFVYG